eukprot:CAMPEP_0116103110 /NCGR_PEP_ID=MMETSP0327-20121206/13710_1 /TAXON_ID=44447 /ORGANISM="Pseudo-nitzschia delicatissima, Strain B596" /LENGTH=402 /DNA_ID=CAMNT_0003595199 /DNA_START=59 /DNA_END=1267 /DNA_ORIENTATION=-
MISIPIFTSTLLLVALLFLSVDARSTTPWNRRLPSLATRPSSMSSHNHLMLPKIRGGESSELDANSPLPTPVSKRIGEGTENEIHSITGGHILRAGKLDPKEAAKPKGNATSSDVIVESSIIKEDKATKKMLKRHKQIAKKLRNRNATNKRRKFMHFTWGMLFASLNHFVPRQFFLPGMMVISGTSLTVELLRYRKGFEWMNNLMHFVLGKSLRKNEMDGKFTGSFYYFSGVTLTSYMFPNPCATLGICQLAIADPTASYFGRATRHIYWSRIGNGFFGIGRNKGLLGFLGGALCCVPLNYRLISLALAKTSATAAAHTIAKPTVLAISLALGAAGALADLMVPTPALTLPKKVCGVKVPPFHLDDNIAIPILSAWACGHILRFAGIPIPPAELTLAKYLIA